MGTSILSAHDQPVEWERLSFPSYICNLTFAYNGTINISFKFFYDLFFFFLRDTANPRRDTIEK